MTSSDVAALAAILLVLAMLIVMLVLLAREHLTLRRAARSWRGVTGGCHKTTDLRASAR